MKAKLSTLLLMILLVSCRGYESRMLSRTPVQTPTSEKTVTSSVATASPRVGSAPSTNATSTPMHTVTPGTQELESLVQVTPILHQPATSLPADGVFFGVYNFEVKSDYLTSPEIQVIHYYVSWDKPEELTLDLEQSRLHGKVPLITIEPWVTASGDNSFVLHDTIAPDGKSPNDHYIVNMAEVIREYGGLVLVRWAHEMELTGLYPWSIGDPELYKWAFIHVHDVFHVLEVSNVLWLWSPAGDPSAESYYPGDAYVDMVGLTMLYNESWSVDQGSTPGVPFSDLFVERYNWASNLNMPIIIVELGVNPDTIVREPAEVQRFKQEWLSDAVTSIDSFPLLQGLVLYDELNAPNDVWGQPDWRIDPRLWIELASNN